MALVTTFATTPLVSLLFPPWYQKKLAAWKRGEIEWDGSRRAPAEDSSDEASIIQDKTQSSDVRKLLVTLRLDSLPSLFTFVTLLGGERDPTAPKTHPSKNSKTTTHDRAPMSRKRPLEVHGLRLLELTERLSSVMKESEADEWTNRDPVVNAFHTFGQLHNVAVSGEVQLVPEGSYGDILSERASSRHSDMILLPWSETGNTSDVTALGFSEAAQSTFTNTTYNHFVTQFLAKAPCNTAVFVNNGFGAVPKEEVRSLHRTTTDLSIRSAGIAHATAPLTDRSHHIFFPFSGGADDRVALRFVLLLAKNPNVTATIVCAGTTTNERERSFFTSMNDSLPSGLAERVLFSSAFEKEGSTASPLTDIVEQARAEMGLAPQNAGDLVVVGRGSGAGKSNEQHDTHSDIKQTLGERATAIIKADVRASVLVLQAGGRGVGME